MLILLLLILTPNKVKGETLAKENTNLCKYELKKENSNEKIELYVMPYIDYGKDQQGKITTDKTVGEYTVEESINPSVYTKGEVEITLTTVIGDYEVVKIVIIRR